ncbi:hypothetical protein [Streptomyces sp. NPDC005283]
MARRRTPQTGDQHDGGYDHDHTGDAHGGPSLLHGGTLGVVRDYPYS